MSKSKAAYHYRNEVGNQFGRLMIIGYIPGKRSPRTTPRYLCRCDCGSTTRPHCQMVIRGGTKSCGCYRQDVGRQAIHKALQAITHIRSLKPKPPPPPPKPQRLPKLPGRGLGWRKSHGKSKSPEYQSWRAMLHRCYNPKHPHFDRYGGADIKVCDRWITSFENFLADVGLRPGQGYSLDRFPDRSGGYHPGNVRWATPTQQGRNSRGNHLVTWQGRTVCLAEWSEITGIPAHAISRRLASGWSAERALTTPRLMKRYIERTPSN